MSDAVVRFAPSRRTTALALARAAIPAGEAFPQGNEATIERLETLLSGFGRETVPAYGRMLDVLEHAPRPSHWGRPFSSLGEAEAERFLAGWAEGALPQRSMAFALLAPLKVAHFDDPAVYRRFGATFRFRQVHEPARWERQVVRGESLEEDFDVECDAVVVGTGAGGAVVAKGLADRGLAVLMLEEGGYRHRDEFDGRGLESIRKLYREMGTIAALGNAYIPVPMGRLVGGSTAINTGTCWRTPEWVLDKWVRAGLSELAPAKMERYFDEVERELQVGLPAPKALGGVARVVARGCDRLGYAHHPVMRNAPGCDGSGVCDTGCPTGAKRSTNVSYVPSALSRGAQLVTGVRAERVLREGDRIVGVEGKVVATGRRVRVRARATVLSCGTAMTPVVLLKQGLGERLPHVGKNLSIHPATMVSALFDEPIRGYAAIPQGYCVPEFRHEGILLLGASAPIDLGAAQFAFVGRKFSDVMDRYDRIASFGVMVEDASRGRVIAGRGFRPTILYRMGREERERMRRGAEIVARIFLAAGAIEVYPAVHDHRVVRSSADLARLRDSLPPASDWLMTAFHPLGTCRMATSAKEGVVSQDHEVFGLSGLYIADGSVVPSSIGVNPQETIMALATRAAERIAARLGA